ncbi:hypothetical protein H2203_005714 [Taxawa tesnikishii (nom. ined.)]|nr:hypothetical protein H2203_005714 [Dothideales sp. JES 119]
MSFKRAFERHLNKELEAAEDHEDRPPPPPPIDIEIQQDPLPVHVFPSYPPPTQQRSGMYVPTPLFILFILVFLFESSVLFVYTVIGLYNAVPSLPIGALQAPPTCNCPAPAVQFPAINVAPNFLVPSAAGIVAEPVTVTQTFDHGSTVTVTATPSASSAPSPSATTSTSTSSATTSTSSTSTSLAGAQSALLSLLPDLQTTNGIVTVTKPIPTVTVLSTESQQLPSITTMTVLSTTTPPPAPPRSTVTQTTVITSGA